MTFCANRSQGSLAKLEGDSADSDTQLTKLDVVLTFQLEVSNLFIISRIVSYYNAIRIEMSDFSITYIPLIILIS